ncbi:hypothetical protein M6B38_234320 [Iris pallida]|uniref:Uncharacterized protein n=1 Tax=Iris pallida TaxID=29817 RepID=A0AAX6DQ00_IRIPA|nr:hypothetical protein M6B38_234320 [Iris pallida]
MSSFWGLIHSWTRRGCVRFSEVMYYSMFLKYHLFDSWIKLMDDWVGIWLGCSVLPIVSDFPFVPSSDRSQYSFMSYILWCLCECP